MTSCDVHATDHYIFALLSWPGTESFHYLCLEIPDEARFPVRQFPFMARVGSVGLTIAGIDGFILTLRFDGPFYVPLYRVYFSPARWGLSMITC